MFKKVAVFTDIHFGLKSNSKVHNDDCEEFIDWYIEQAKENGWGGTKRTAECSEQWFIHKQQ